MTRRPTRRNLEKRLADLDDGDDGDRFRLTITDSVVGPNGEERGAFRRTEIYRDERGDWHSESERLDDGGDP